MLTPEVIDFIKKQISSGKKLDEIAQSLQTNGWQKQQVDEAFTELGYQTAAPNTAPAPGETILSQTRHKNIVPVVLLFLTLILVSVIGIFLFNALSTKNSNKNKVYTSDVQNPTPTLTKITAIPSQMQESINGSDCGIYSFTVIGPSPVQMQGIDCFIKATQICSVAKLELNSSLNMAGITTSTLDVDIQGLKDNKCSLHLKQGAINHIFPSGVPQDQQQIVLQALQKKVGTEGVCLFDVNSDLTEVFNNWKKGNFSASTDPSQGDFSKASCSGTYFSQN